MPIIPARVELSPEEYQAMLDEATRLSADLAGFIAQMLLYRKDADGQLAKQFTFIEALQKTLDGLIAKDLAALRRKDEQHDADLGELGTRLGNAESTQNKHGARIVTAESRLNTIDALNKRQDERLKAVEDRAATTEGVTAAQAGAIGELRRRADAVDKLNLERGATLSELIEHVNRLGASMAELHAKMDALSQSDSKQSEIIRQWTDMQRIQGDTIMNLLERVAKLEPPRIIDESLTEPPSVEGPEA